MDILEKAFATYLDYWFQDLEDGTAAEPSVYLNPDVYSGFYRRNDYELGLADNGKHVYTITAYSVHNTNGIMLDKQLNRREILKYFEAAVKLGE